MSVVATFDEENPNWSALNGQNVYFIAAQESHANDTLRAKGYVTLNEIYEMLGLQQNEEGALAGWVGDVEVDFGIRSEIGGEGPISLIFNINSTNVFRDK